MHKQVTHNDLCRYAYKAVINEKFGDGIMSAISFSTSVKKGTIVSADVTMLRCRIYLLTARLSTETDDKGQDWVNIHLRGKW